MRRIRLDLLPQPVDMGFQRMGGDRAVVAPDLVQQHLPRHRLAAGAVEEFQDRAFLVGQPDLAVAGRLQQQLGAGAEHVGPDGEDRILGIVEDPELGPHPRQQFRQPEGLGDVVVGPGIEAAHHIGFGIGAGQHDDRHAEAIAPQLGAEVPAIGIGQADIEQDGVVARIGAGQLRLGLLHAVGLIGGEVAVEGNLLGQGGAQRGIVFDDEDRTRRHHGTSAVPDKWLKASCCITAAVAERERLKPMREKAHLTDAFIRLHNIATQVRPKQLPRSGGNPDRRTGPKTPDSRGLAANGHDGAAGVPATLFRPDPVTGQLS